MKNRFTKQELRAQFWLGVFAIMIGVGVYFGNVKFSLGNGASPSSTYSAEKITDNLAHLQNITGKMRASPGSLEAREPIIKGTTNSLKIQTYDFTEKRIKSLFKDLLNKGTDIQFIMEDKKYQQFQNTFKQIQEHFSGYANFAIKSDKQMGTEYTHSKINIVDSGFIIQTANLTHSSFFANREHFFYSQHSGVLASLETVFDKDREGGKIQLKDIHPNLVICNINCRTVIETLLRDAKESIIIQTQYITDASILEILKNKTDKELKVIVADTESSFDSLKALPTNTKRLAKYYNHTKMILIDKKILLLGSMNLSANSLDKNREIGILLLDPELIHQFLAGFENDWKIAK